MENEHTALTGTTTTITTTKKKPGSTRLVVVSTFAITLLLGLALLLYTGPPSRRRSNLAAGGGGGGMTRGGAITAASLTLLSNDEDSQPLVLGGTYMSHGDYCYTCGGGDTGQKLGYCWNNLPCLPSCDNARGVGSIGNNDCGDHCKNFECG